MLVYSQFLVLITGTSAEGLGAETAISLAKAQPKLLVLAARSKSKVQPVIDSIEESCPGTNVSFIELDLANQASIKGTVKHIKELGIIVDVLINNAGVMACPYWKTADDIEMQFGTNQVGPFLFTNLLLRENLISTGGRIVIVSSSASVRDPSALLPFLDDLTYDNGNTYNSFVAYSLSKLANVLYARKLASLVQKNGITTLSLDPGSIKTPLQRHFTEAARNDAIEQAKKDNPNFLMPVRKSLQEGCATQLRAALDPALEKWSGAYLQDSQIVEHELHVQAYGAADKVWKLCEDFVGERFDFSEIDVREHSTNLPT
jgi:NAD(P)-dependent dehydrogenase (short-subunit alcohol dehydrogenase family)